MGKILAFSVPSGLLWSIYPAAAHRAAGSGAALAVVSAIVTAFLTSLVVLGMHRRTGQGAWALGIASLPIGTFLFGVVDDCFQGLALLVSGGAYGIVDGGFNPLVKGLGYAFLSFIPPMGLILLPFAVLTTKLLLTFDSKNERRPLPKSLPEFSGPEIGCP